MMNNAVTFQPSLQAVQFGRKKETVAKLGATTAATVASILATEVGEYAGQSVGNGYILTLGKEAPNTAINTNDATHLQGGVQQPITNITLNPGTWVKYGVDGLLIFGIVAAAIFGLTRSKETSAIS